MNWTDFCKGLKPGAVPPVLVLVGPEQYAADAALRAIRTALFGDRGSEAPGSSYLGAETDVRTVLADVRNLSLFLPHTLVVVDQADRLVADGKEVLAEYAAAPNPNGCLVLRTAKWDGRTRLAKLLKKRAVVECVPPHERELPAWILRRATERGLRLESDVARELADLVGANLLQLDQQLDKLSLYAQGRPTISRADVAAVVARTSTDAIYALTDAVAQRQPAQAFEVLHSLFLAGDDAGHFIAVLATHFRRLFRASVLQELGRSSQEIATVLGTKPYFAEKLGQQARALTRPGIRRAFSLLLEADRQLKTSALPDRLAAERLVLRLIFQDQGTAQPARRR